MLTLKDLKFDIRKTLFKELPSGEGKFSCYIEIETNGFKFDGEYWEPSLTHQGLLFNASSAQELVNTSHYWKDSYGEGTDSPHPEIGMLYVFSHTKTFENKMEFGEIKNHELEFSWSGLADIYWNEEYGDMVPFKVATALKI